MITDAARLLGDIPRRRWFGTKGRALRRVDVLDEATIDDGPPTVVLALVAVRFEEGGTHFYSVPVVVEEDGTQTDAWDDIERLGLIGELMAHGVTVKGLCGAFEFGGPGLDPLSPPGESSVETMNAEQSNSSLVLDDEIIIKFFRRLQVGPNPDLELNRLLTNEGFQNIPLHVGEIAYVGEWDGQDVTVDLAIAQHFISDGKLGWDVALDDLGHLFDWARGRRGAAAPDLVEERSAEILDAFDQLGDVTASLHVLLAREELDPDVSREMIDSNDLKAYAERVEAALDALLQEGVRELERLSPAVRARIDALRSVPNAGGKTRVHGDYHLGQVMLAARGWMILDFEGEPLRSFEDRRAKQSPLRDVASMLRSFSYAPVASLFERAQPNTEEWRALEPWAATWEQLARDRFLTAYLRRSHEGQFLPPDRNLLAVMLDVFEIDKALYELAYERGHRPQWSRIPLRGIAHALEGGLRR